MMHVGGPPIRHDVSNGSSATRRQLNVAMVAATCAAIRRSRPNGVVAEPSRSCEPAYTEQRQLPPGGNVLARLVRHQGAPGDQDPEAGHNCGRNGQDQWLPPIFRNLTPSPHKITPCAKALALRGLPGLGSKCHWAIPDYLQRSARHIASATDVEHAYAVGRAAVEFAIAGKSAIMPAIRRLSDVPYRWDIVDAPLSAVANQEKLLPPDFISADGFGITEAARRDLGPLIVGEAYPPYTNGLPEYVKLRNVAVPRRLSRAFDIPRL
jgi:hypothetical protein